VGRALTHYQVAIARPYFFGWVPLPPRPLSHVLTSRAAPCSSPTNGWSPVSRRSVPEDALNALRGAEGGPASLWDTLVQRKLATDAQILGAIAARFRLPLADFSGLDTRVKGRDSRAAGSQVQRPAAQGHRRIPRGSHRQSVRPGCEKTLAFATGRRCACRRFSGAHSGEARRSIPQRRRGF
jgi:hypothetical protein